jgi:hypothetical protein
VKIEEQPKIRFRSSQWFCLASLGLQALCALLEIELKCILLLDAGKSPESISEYLFLSRNTVANYVKRYQAGGLGKRGLRAKVSHDP